MKQEPHWLLVPLSLVTVLSGTASQASAPGTNARVVIIRANLIDGVLSQPLHDATATVRDGHIESVTTGAGQIPPGAADWTSVGTSCAWLCRRPYTYFRFARRRLAVPSGATTVRNLGTDHFAAWTGTSWKSDTAGWSRGSWRQPVRSRAPFQIP